jgi:hypothetical protein
MLRIQTYVCMGIKCFLFWRRETNTAWIPEMRGYSLLSDKEFNIWIDYISILYYSDLLPLLFCLTAKLLASIKISWNLDIYIYFFFFGHTLLFPLRDGVYSHFTEYELVLVTCLTYRIDSSNVWATKAGS